MSMWSDYLALEDLRDEIREKRPPELRSYYDNEGREVVNFVVGELIAGIHYGTDMHGDEYADIGWTLPPGIGVVSADVININDCAPIDPIAVRIWLKDN